MVAVAQNWTVVSSLLFPTMFSGTFAAGDEPPGVAAVVRRTEQSSDLKLLRPPVTEQKVGNFVTGVRLKLKQVDTPGSLPQRAAYVKQLVGVLERFVVKDVMRHDLSRFDDRTLWLSDDAGARVIRLLGDLDAVEAVEAIAEYLLLPTDLELFRKTGVPDCPTSWALFQLGDGSLPILRKKMTSETHSIRREASRTAAYILGPRAEEELQKWIAAAETEEVRERLRENNGIFRLMTAYGKTSSKSVTPEEYRQKTLERDRAYLERNLNHRDPDAGRSLQ